METLSALGEPKVLQEQPGVAVVTAVRVHICGCVCGLGECSGMFWVEAEVRGRGHAGVCLLVHVKTRVSGFVSTTGTFVGPNDTMFKKKKRPFIIDKAHL